MLSCGGKQENTITRLSNDGAKVLLKKKKDWTKCLVFLEIFSM